MLFFFLFFFVFCFYLSEKVSFEIACESTAKQMIQLNIKTYFLWKIIKKKKKKKKWKLASPRNLVQPAKTQSDQSLL